MSGDKLPHDLIRLQDLAAIKKQVKQGRPLFSATHEEIVTGQTTDVYFLRTLEVLEAVKKDNTPVVAEIFANRHGLMAGMEETLRLLAARPLSLEPIEVLVLEDGERFAPKEPVLRITGPYNAFGVYETAILGILSHSCGWATATAEVVEAAAGKPVLSFGARHVHPAVSPVMERAAMVAGAQGASSVLGAAIWGIEPSGTTSHAFMLIMGDTLVATLAYDEHLKEDSPRIMLADTFKDEAEEALRLADALGKGLVGIRLDTPGERGGVRPELVTEVRARLDQAGFGHVRILVTGGLTPERIRPLVAAGTDIFGVGGYIASAPPINMTMDIKEIAGQPIAKRGRIPGITPTDRLKPRQLF